MRRSDPGVERLTRAMETIREEITLRDLLAWEPRLEVASPREPVDGAPDPLAREVDWVLTARSTAPMLPLLRGGELIILPNRIVAETGIPFPRLINELMMQPIAGILAERPVPEMPDTPLVILAVNRVAPETESDLNRLLSTRRRELLQAATEVNREIAEAIQRQARPGELLHALGERLGMPISIVEDDGAVLFATGSGRTNIPREERTGPAWQRASLKADQELWLGPIAPAQQALGRMTIGLIRTGMQRLLDREATAAPRGSARSAALNALLAPPAGVNRATLVDQAFSAGIPPGRALRVAMASAEVSDSAARRSLAPFGDVHDAGRLDDLETRLTVSTPASRPGATALAVETGWIALSAPVTSARELPDAARQARYLARLLAVGSLAGPIADFADDAALGVYRVLYDGWGTAAQARYCAALLGDLRREDRHGALQETLRIFLEEGGSLRPTAERLGIHRNTLTYRLRQIRSIVQADLDSPQVRLGLHLALAADRLPEAPG